MPPLCNLVYIDCGELCVSIPIGFEVSKGSTVHGCFVVVANPSPCIVSPSTKIKCVKRRRFKVVELRNNIAFIDEDRHQCFVYPKKLIHEIVKEYIEPIATGRAPKNIGCLLVGAPGCGKTTLMNILSEMYGLPVMKFSPDKILNMYVGQSEKAAREFFNNIRRSEPCIAIIDDAEWIIGARRLGGSPEVEQISLNIKNIMFEELQRLSNENRKVVVFAATNVSPSAIDPAFQRSGRLGKPIIFPLPDLEAVEFVLRFYLGNRRDIHDLAKKFVNAGEPMSNIMEAIKDIKEGKQPKLGGSGRGYKRIVAEPIRELEDLERLIPRESLERPSRFWAPYPWRIGLAIIACYLATIGKGCIVITDYRYVDEAIHMANVYNSAIITPSSIPEEVLRFIDLNAEVPVIVIGKDPPKIEALTLPNITYLAERRYIVEAVSRFYSVEIPSDVKEKIMKMLNGDRFELALETIVSTRYVSEELIQWIQSTR